MEYFPCKTTYNTDPYQYAGLWDRSTTMSILHIFDCIYKNSDKNGSYVHILFSDFFKGLNLVGLIRHTKAWKAGGSWMSHKMGTTLSVTMSAPV